MSGCPVMRSVCRGGGGRLCRRLIRDGLDRRFLLGRRSTGRRLDAGLHLIHQFLQFGNLSLLGQGAAQLFRGKLLVDIRLDGADETLRLADP